MLPPFLAIDPGTKSTGVAVFREGQLCHYGSITADPKLPSYERIGAITELIKDYQASHAPDATAVACEKPAAAFGARRPAPELDTLIRAIRSWTKTVKTTGAKKLGWTEYNPKTVAACVAFQGLPHHPDGPKAHLRAGVTALYEKVLTAPGAPLQAPLPQDVIDAIAVGHCHLSEMINNGLTGDAA